MIQGLCRESGLPIEKLSEWTMAQFKKPVAQLTSAEASATIDKLQKRSSGEAKPPTTTSEIDEKASKEIADMAWGDKSKTVDAPVGSVDRLTHFMKRIEASATPEELSDIEGEIQLDVVMKDTARKTLLSLLDARKKNQA
jgi:hypothetical protein